MGVIYEPSGKAREYCELSVNLYAGCGHGCTYCYAPACLHKSRQEFTAAKERKLILDNIAKEAGRYAGKECLLCFTCDPYQALDVELQTTRYAIKLLQESGVKVVILTKGGKRSERDFDILSKKKHLSKFGATLTFISDADSLKWEPDAALPGERFDALRKAHKLGITTWASLEPVIDPAQSLQIIRETKDFVDIFKVGKWNHDSEANKINWYEFASEAKELLDNYGKTYYIKKDLAKYLDTKETQHNNLQLI